MCKWAFHLITRALDDFLFVEETNSAFRLLQKRNFFSKGSKLRLPTATNQSVSAATEERERDIRGTRELFRLQRKMADEEGKDLIRNAHGSQKVRSGRRVMDHFAAEPQHRGKESFSFDPTV